MSDDVNGRRRNWASRQSFQPTFNTVNSHLLDFGYVGYRRAYPAM